jgi:hypothetical protein
VLVAAGSPMPLGVSNLDSTVNFNLYLTNNVNGRAEYLVGSSEPLPSNRNFILTGILLR